MAKELASTFLDYGETMTSSFNEVPVNELDLALFSEFIYFHLEIYLKDGSVSKKLYELHDDHKQDAFLHRPAFHEHDIRLYNILTTNPRYKNVVVSHFKMVLEKSNFEQFGALTYSLPNGIDVATFRGTDSTIVGWREDFEMAYKTPVPAQEEAAKYLNQYFLKGSRPLYIVGHSKGGNLAMYAYIKADLSIEDMTIGVYSFDGPGFLEGSLEKVGFAYKKEKITKIVPYQSIIGQVFASDLAMRYVESDAHYLYQHSLYNWHVKGNHFVYLPNMDPKVSSAMDALNEWLGDASNEEKELLVSTLYDLLVDSDYTFSNQILANKRKALARVYSKFKDVPKEERDKVSAILKTILGTLGKALF